MCNRIGGVGIDLCAVSRMRRLLETRFVERYFTPAEGAYIRSRGAGAAQSLAGLFAAKEAVLKALGVGITVPLTQVEITHSPAGQPRCRLLGGAEALLRGGCLHLSISHEGDFATALCVWERPAGEADRPSADSD